MKKLLLSVFILISASLYPQDIDWSSMHGLMNEKGQISIEISGYEIYILTEKGQIDKEKDIQKIAKKYKLKNVYWKYDYPLDKPNVVLESQNEYKNTNETKVNQTCYIFPDSDKKLRTILMNTINKRDTVLELSLVKAYFDDRLSPYISTNLKADTISFAGRDIHLGSACSWRSPHNLYCMGGQMSWSEFPTFDAAETDINARIASNVNDKLMILQEEDIDVVFEDIPSLAHRVVYRQIPSSRMTYYYRSNPLIVYYIVQEVRGRYISCVMSNYGYNKNDYELAPLLQQVMSIPEMPETAHNKFDIPEPDQEYEEVVAKKYFIPLFEIRSGVWQPLGKLRDVYKFAPSVELFMGLPIRSNMTIDLGLQFAFPSNRKEFDFYTYGYVYPVKTNLLGSINVRWRYEQPVAKNVYFTNYLGAGVGILQTNMKKEEDDDIYHSVETFDIFGGAGLRYKWFGVFAEYHFLPYSIAGKMKQSQGNSMINTGISLSF